MFNESSKSVDENFPLVSVVVITYNSEKFVLETLESIKVQTYQNIELIISDDCSSDQTINVCKNWVNDNEVRFRRVQILCADRNSGVSQNCNRGFLATEGDWVKLIAGDDLLAKDGIEKYVEYIFKKGDAKVLVSDLMYFGEKNELCVIDTTINKLTSQQQLINALLNNKRVPALGPSGFYHRETLASIGGYDTTYPSIEDYPLMLKFLDRGIKIYALNQKCVHYRIQNGSISTNSNFSDRFIEMFEACAVPIIKKRRLFLVLHHFHVVKILSQRKNTLLKYSVFRYLLKASSIYAWMDLFDREKK